MSLAIELTLRLAAGMDKLPEALRDRQADYLADQQYADGGFSGRRGESDFYYTGFAVRGLALLGRLEGRAARNAAEFLKQGFSRRLPGADFVSLVSAAVVLEAAAGIDCFAAAGIDRRELVDRFTEPLRRPDGGYGKSQRSGPSSTYHTFLLVMCRELVGLPVTGPERIVELVRRRQRDDGGFVEVESMRHGGTNPTAAAVGLLSALGGLEPEAARRAAGFLRSMQNAEGGLLANPRVPIADLLSTFTGLVALGQLQASRQIDLDRVAGFTASLEEPAGGFRGAAWDSETDVEYTFYGLGTSALLAAES